MIRTGIYRGGKVYYRVMCPPHLSGGSWETGWSGINRGGMKVISHEVINRLDMWPTGNQEVEFELIDNKAVVRKLGNILNNDEADRQLEILFPY